MRHLKNNQGFTLIELVVSIGTAAVVMAAAAMFLLMGVRTQRDVLDASKEQQTLRTVFAMLENLASEGTIQKVEITKYGWTLSDGTEGIVTYDAQTGVLNTNEMPILSGLNTAHAELNGKLLTFTFETDLQSYSSGVYCRLLKSAADENGDISSILKDGEKEVTDTSDKRAVFIQRLCKEYGSTGQIKVPIGEECVGTYYAQWYNDSWAANTPWCACFLSWAAQDITGAPQFADVDDGVKAFQAQTDGWKLSAPTAGNYIFFDWEGNLLGNPDRGDPDHVGVVIHIAGSTIFTIEGNSGGRVAIRSYHESDPRIMGYGVVNWAATE